jgi:hypothetical protein
VRIGPSDVSALLRANKVPVRIFDFDHGPDSFATVRQLVEEFFRKDLSVVFPFILGDAKHTVLVVGTTSDALVVFDPAVRCQRAVDALKSHDLRPFLLRSWRSHQFQLLAAGPDDQEHPEWLLHDDSHVKYGGKVLMATRPARYVEGNDGTGKTARQLGT